MITQQHANPLMNYVVHVPQKIDEKQKQKTKPPKYTNYLLNHLGAPELGGNIKESIALYEDYEKAKYAKLANVQNISQLPTENRIHCLTTISEQVKQITKGKHKYCTEQQAEVHEDMTNFITSTQNLVNVYGLSEHQIMCVFNEMKKDGLLRF